MLKGRPAENGRVGPYTILTNEEELLIKWILTHARNCNFKTQQYWNHAENELWLKHNSVEINNINEYVTSEDGK